MGVGRVTPFVLFGRGCIPGHPMASEAAACATVAMARTGTLQACRGTGESDKVLFCPVWSQLALF